MSKTPKSAPPVKIKGIPVELGGDTFVVPPLALGALEQLQERLQNFTGGTDPESISVVVDATHAALQRNYPDITCEEVKGRLDVGNMADAMQAVMDVSGLRRKALENADKAPEVAEEPEGPSTGEQSTPT